MRTLFAGATIGLAACQPVTRPETSMHALATADHSGHSVDTRIRARAIGLESLVLPPGATLDVQLIEDGTDPQQTKVLNTEHASNLRGSPFAFDIPYDAASLETSARHGLRACLRDAKGTLLFATAALVPVSPGSQAVVEFRLVRADLR
ncbi:MAG: YbaY family lipoprotein [Dokdonella sp.]|uniref:YbaY family lipoprotein n=1 Tax=Dokdonella sp. TaxID=2291710 RepID=UPI0032663529